MRIRSGMVDVWKIGIRQFGLEFSNSRSGFAREVSGSKNRTGETI
jgi:hypothetical protein